MSNVPTVEIDQVSEPGPFAERLARIQELWRQTTFFLFDARAGGPRPLAPCRATGAHRPADRRPRQVDREHEEQHDRRHARSRRIEMSFPALMAAARTPPLLTVNWTTSAPLPVPVAMLESVLRNRRWTPSDRFRVSTEIEPWYVVGRSRRTCPWSTGFAWKCGSSDTKTRVGFDPPEPLASLMLQTQTPDTGPVGRFVTTRAFSYSVPVYQPRPSRNGGVR
jgi:hypothetical protein